ncbi:MAG: hypothetical protein K8S23_03180 [Candidatus Cloacimonetes bacterium]|nr:hypothetical protein [Candidatus Cloacimonadota bacterium]
MRFEKEMIPLLNNYLISNLGFEKIINEFNSGYGIADVIGIKKKPDSAIYSFSSVFEVGIISKISRKNWTLFSEIMNESMYSEKYLKYNILNKFVKNGFLIKKKNQYKRLRELPNEYNPLIAIEAKLINWKAAFSQALRYKKYADYTYIAIPDDIASKIDIDLFKENKIGILTVNKYQIKVFLKANKNPKKDVLYSLVAKSYLSEQIT